LYVAAFGSAKVAALPVATLSSGAFVPDANRHIGVPDGPSGLALDASGQRLTCTSRIAHKISVIDTASRAVLASVPLFSPEARVVKNGRRFLYDANLTSANGTSSCASCHIFADMDQLSWDLGNPDDRRS
jgi:DNA-binding beta-propeller fold protein YncE